MNFLALAEIVPVSHEALDSMIPGPMKGLSEFVLTRSRIQVFFKPLVVTSVVKFNLLMLVS